jgi:hypothetical protein
MILRRFYWMDRGHNISETLLEYQPWTTRQTRLRFHSPEASVGRDFSKPFLADGCLISGGLVCLVSSMI